MICRIKRYEYVAVVLFLTFVQWYKSEIKLIIPLLPLPMFVFPIFRNPQQSHRFCTWLQQVYVILYQSFFLVFQSVFIRNFITAKMFWNTKYFEFLKRRTWQLNDGLPIWAEIAKDGQKKQIKSNRIVRIYCCGQPENTVPSFNPKGCLPWYSTLAKKCCKYLQIIFCKEFKNLRPNSKFK